MIKVDEDLCKGCTVCILFCSQNVYKLSKKLDKKGVHLPEPVNQDKCIECNLCVMICPDQAITVGENKAKKNTFWRFKK